MALQQPKLLHLAHGEALSFQVRRWEQDSLDFYDETTRRLIRGTSLRVYSEAPLEPSGDAYFDVVGRRLQAQLRPHLEGGRFRGRTFRLTAIGSGFERTYTLHVT